MSTREPPFKIGDSIAEKYEVKSLLGRGGHAFVFECHDRFLDEIAAIKVIPDPPQRGEDLRRRAREEARLLYRLRHPNVVAVRDAGETAGMVYIVMEKLEGITLRTMLRKLERLSILEALVIARQIADGVSVAHAQNVVHRDLKPENVFILAPNNHVKVLDFGIAKFMGHGLETTEHDVLHGTVAYMSPEHLQGRGVTARSDVYQLGTILFEMLAGVNPCLHEVEDPTFEQLAWIQISRPTPELAKLAPGVPPSIEWLVRHATAKNPEQRFASMQAMRTAIEAVTREYLESVPLETLRIRLLVPKTEAQTGPGFSSTVPSPRQLETLTRRTASDREGTPTPGFSAVGIAASGVTAPMTPNPVTPRPDDERAAATAPSVTRTLSGGRRSEETPMPVGARASWGRLALVAIPLGTVIGLTMNALTPRHETDDRAAASAVPPAPTATLEATTTAPTPPPPSVVPEVGNPAAPPAASTANAPSAAPTPAPVAPRTVSRKRTTPSASAATAPTPPPTASVKSDVERMRERARAFELEARSGAAGKPGTR
ncbi:MAG TPA: serine/threonine-protein kinase [Polyangiaceae bacterium]